MADVGHARTDKHFVDFLTGNGGQQTGVIRVVWCTEHRLINVSQIDFDDVRVFGARMEMPGCSLCMGNQARVEPNSTVVSTSTRNFPNRLGDGANVYLASAELASVASILGRLPSVEEYMAYAAEINTMAADVYRYLSFDQIAEFREAAANANIPVIQA